MVNMAPKPVILALDTATGPCSAAVWKDGRVASYVENLKPAVQSTALMPMAEDALKKAGITYQDLTLVACTTGPGSFTGIRVALAAARAIAFAANIPGAGFTSLEVLAFASQQDKVLALLTAGKGEHYYQHFPGGEPTLGTLEQAAQGGPVFTIGNAMIPGFTASEITFPRADALAALAASKTDYAELSPFYIRPPDAKPQVKV